MEVETIRSNPPLFKYMKAEYADAFLSEGKLRLNSFEYFRRFADETRVDLKEGTSNIVFNLPDTTTVELVFNPIKYAYIFCSSLELSSDIMKSFEGADACLKINDGHAFAKEIFKKMQNGRGYIATTCIYKETNDIERFLFTMPPGTTTMIPTGNPGLRPGTIEGQISFNPQWFDQKGSELSNHRYFIKGKSFSDEREFRIVWPLDQTTGDIPNHIDIVCPEAAQYCERVI